MGAAERAGRTFKLLPTDLSAAFNEFGEGLNEDKNFDKAVLFVSLSSINLIRRLYFASRKKSKDFETYSLGLKLI